MVWAGRYGRGANRKKAGVMSGYEKQYEQLLEQRKRKGEVLWYAYEAAKIRLADKTFYTPDFVVMREDMGLEFHEVKGLWEPAARVKIKVAAETFPCKFIAITKEKGQWVFEEI